MVCTWRPELEPRMGSGPCKELLRVVRCFVGVLRPDPGPSAGNFTTQAQDEAVAQDCTLGSTQIQSQSLNRFKGGSSMLIRIPHGSLMLCFG